MRDTDGQTERALLNKNVSFSARSSGSMLRDCSRLEYNCSSCTRGQRARRHRCHWYRAEVVRRLVLHGHAQSGLRLGSIPRHHHGDVREHFARCSSQHSLII